MIPQQLKQTDYRFYLVQRDGKLPIEQSWNDKNCYPFTEIKLQTWIKMGGNYGVVTGYSNLIVLDFDNLDFYNSVKDRLPPTFTVLSATRKLPHLYYELNGEMFKKIAVRNKEGKTLCDIQAHHCGIVAPGSCVNRKYYTVERDIPINTIMPLELDFLLPEQEKQFRKPTVYSSDLPLDNEAINATIKVLLQHKIKRTKERMFQCPFHEMHGQGNLSIMPNGWIYCFHTQTCWRSAQDFVNELTNFTVSKEKGYMKNYFTNNQSIVSIT